MANNESVRYVNIANHENVVAYLDTLSVQQREYATKYLDYLRNGGAQPDLRDFDADEVSYRIAQQIRLALAKFL
jgi:hypothetical protein